MRKEAGITKGVFIILLAGISLISVAGAQEIYNIRDGGQRLDIHADCAYFRADDEGFLALEVYYKVYNEYLTFVRNGEQFTADYEVSIIIYDDKNYQVDSYNRRKDISVSSYDMTLKGSDFRTSQVDFRLKPGKYKIYCRIEDKRSTKFADKTIKTELPEYNFRHARLSGVEFVHLVDSAQDGSPFNKGDWSVIPAVVRIYEGTTEAPLLYYHEIYQGRDNREDVMIETRVLNAKLNMVYWDTLSATFSDGIVRQLRQINLTNIPSGEYFLEVILRGRRNAEVATSRHPFFINWSPEAMIINDYQKAIKQLELVADHEGIDKIKKATTPEDRLWAWRAFWKERDPTPNTEYNEAREAYYQRINFANKYFTVMNKEGWRTDRGRIFIQYGEPDQTEDRPFELESYAYQVWYYYRLPMQRRFTFVDEWGDGDYRLLYPYDGIIR